MSQFNPPVTIFSIEFLGAIPLYDPVTNELINPLIKLGLSPHSADESEHPPFEQGRPQWLRGTHNLPVAYVRGRCVQLRVVLLGMLRNDLHISITSISATGSHGGSKKVSLNSWSQSNQNLSDPIDVELSAPVPDSIGAQDYTLHWYIEYHRSQHPNELSQKCYIGTTTHTIYTTYANPNVDHIYEPVMRWSCQWASGQTKPKAICDALLSNLPTSGLVYGLQSPGDSVRDLLLCGGGMCVAWHHFFHDLGGCQGVDIGGCGMTICIEKRTHSGDEEFWNGVVATTGGLNQALPTFDPTLFYINNQHFPIGDTPVPIDTVVARWYVFWGSYCPSGGTPAHYLNCFQDNQGRVYLYDPSFGFGPLEFGEQLPDGNLTGLQLAYFKVAYLEKIFPYLMGTIRNGAVTYKAESSCPPKYGLLVRTELIPTEYITIKLSCRR